MVTLPFTMFCQFFVKNCHLPTWPSVEFNQQTFGPITFQICLDLHPFKLNDSYAGWGSKAVHD
jgi:hypothetical protein